MVDVSLGKFICTLYNSYFFILDVLSSVLWRDSCRDLTSPHLVDLAKGLPDVVLLSKAPSTPDKYRLAWLNWKRCAARFPCIAAFPAKPFHVALYLKDLLSSANSIAPISSAVYGIRWAHEVAGEPSPTDHSIVKSTVEGCKRLLAKPVKPKDPLPADVFMRLVQALGGAEADIDTLRFLVLSLLGYAGFMRVSELLQVKLKDIQFFQTHMSILVPKRKNDQYREGHVVNIARTGSLTCPVGMTERLIAKAQCQDDGHLICRVVRSKKGLRACPSGISYTRALEILKAGMKPFLGEDFNFGSHSLKSGAATVAMASGLDADAIDKHAGWRSKSSKFRYISDSLDRKLSVSGAIGL